MSFLAKLFNHYQITEGDYALLLRESSYEDIPSIQSHPETRKAILRINQAIERKERVLVYGDYDCDGVMSASIMTILLKRLGLEVKTYLPSRYLDGYGLNVRNVEAISKAGYSLIVTVDNGVTANEAIDRAKELGIDVIVLDHHDFQMENIPDCVAVIHPETVGVNQPSISAGEVTYLFAKAVLEKDDDYLATLAGVSTLSDMMVLKSYNRSLVNIAIRNIRKNAYNQFISLAEGRPINAETLQMSIIPKINAIGRLIEGNEINRLIPYFVSEDANKIRLISDWMNSVNQSRKELTKSTMDSLHIEGTPEALCIIVDEPEGMNGLLANRLLMEYGVPVAVFSHSKENHDVLVGSLRSKEGFSILGALENTKVSLLSHGGHELAGACRIKVEDFEAFKKDFTFFALANRFKKPKEDLIPLDLRECTMQNAKIVESFGPFGQGWKRPKFLLEVDPNTLTFTRDGRFLSTRLQSDVQLFSFDLSCSSFDLSKKARLEVEFALETFRGKTQARLLAKLAD